MIRNTIFYSFISFLDMYGYIILALMILMIIFIVILGLIRLYYLSHSCELNFSDQIQGEPLVSIHLPICNEPPHLVIETIDSVVKLDYPNYELLVISNNTSDPNLWKPIEVKISSLDDRFKFIHKEKVPGYKAGALNLGLEFRDICADYIFTLDADYILEKDALNIAIGTIQKKKVHVLQFPQSYRNTSAETDGLEINYKHYFDCYLSSVKSKILTLPTGTLTMIKDDFFKDGFRWPTDSITEDASFGVDLMRFNTKIGFCNRVIGKGLMPTDPMDLKKQFRRWVFGNFQVFMKVLISKEIPIMNKIHFCTLLFAWMNLLGIVFLLLALSLPLLILDAPQGHIIFILGFCGILLHSFFQIVIFSKIEGSDLKSGWKGFLIHLGLLEVGAFYWINYIFTKEKPFIRTSKFIKSNARTNRFYGFPLIVFIISIICFIFQPSIIIILFAAFAIFVLYAKIYRDQELRGSKLNLFNLSK